MGHLFFKRKASFGDAGRKETVTARLPLRYQNIRPIGCKWISEANGLRGLVRNHVTNQRASRIDITKSSSDCLYINNKMPSNVDT